MFIFQLSPSKIFNSTRIKFSNYNVIFKGGFYGEKSIFIQFSNKMLIRKMNNENNGWMKNRKKEVNLIKIIF